MFNIFSKHFIATHKTSKFIFNPLKLKRERETEEKEGGSVRRYIQNWGEELSLQLWRSPGSARSSFW
jgi:hypothetical protein